PRPRVEGGASIQPLVALQVDGRLPHMDALQPEVRQPFREVGVDHEESKRSHSPHAEKRLDQDHDYAGGPGLRFTAPWIDAGMGMCLVPRKTGDRLWQPALLEQGTEREEPFRDLVKLVPAVRRLPRASR